MSVTTTHVLHQPLSPNVGFPGIGTHAVPGRLGNRCLHFSVSDDFSLLPNCPSSDSMLTLNEQADEHRALLEKFISERYLAAYGATLTQFMPRLFALTSAQHGLIGAVGIRPATHPLFLERYLDLPIEEAIGTSLGLKVLRHQIVEVGHFAGGGHAGTARSGSGVARAMITLLTAALFHEGFRWVVFTGTTGLRNAFYRLKLNPRDLAVADPTRLTERELLQWGSYYKGSPKVQFGNITEGFAALRYADDADGDGDHTGILASVRVAQS